jgi:hypothetical protein
MSKRLRYILIPGAVPAIAVLLFIIFFGGPLKLRSDVIRHHKTAFREVNDRMKADYGIDYLKADNSKVSCYDPSDPLNSFTWRTCGVFTYTEPVIADEAFISNWRASSPGFEAWLLDNGWQKVWNADQPIAEILDKPDNHGSIGVNYIKEYGRVSCTLTLMWIKPEVTNRLDSSEQCIGVIE